MADEEEGVLASQASHRIHSSSDRVLRHRSLQGAAACAAGIQELPAVVASAQDLEGTSFQDELGVEVPHLREP